MLNSCFIFIDVRTNLMIRKIFCSAVSVVAMIALPLTLFAAPVTPFTKQQQAKPTANAPTAQPQITPVPPNIDAAGYVLMDANSGQVLAAKNPDQRLAPASLTKMMTSYIVSAALDVNRVHLDDLVPVSKEAWQTGGSKMFIKVDDKVPLRDLMQGMIVDSGNDACVALAEFVAGSQDSFVNLMNQQAAILGMKNTHFMDVNGLPDKGHYSSPRDLALLGRALVFDFPQDYQWYSQKWFTYNNIRQPNRNRLLWRDPTVDGIKTGHTDDAGFCLVASAKRNGMRLISVVMGAPSDSARANDSEQLLTYGFRFFTSHKLFPANKPLTMARVWYGESNEIPAGTERDVYVALPSSQDAAVKTDVQIQNDLQAPIKKGQEIGKISVIVNDKILTEQPLIALKDNPLGGLWQRSWDHIGAWFSKVF
jgi:D-alanyl-D-alanine carboxypeptidase (penicillin-binding protein 5/6)